MRIPITKCALVLLAVTAWQIACLAPAAELGAVALDAGDLSLAFDLGASGGVRSVVDRRTGTEIRSDASATPMLFQFTYVLPSGHAAVYSNHDAGSLDHELRDEGGRRVLELSYRDVGLEGLDVVCTVAADVDHETQWRIEMTSKEEFSLRSVSYPCLSGLSGVGGDSADDWLVYPLYEGLLIPDYQGAIRKWGNWSWTSQVAYPTQLSMQFMAQYDASVGLYMAALDASGTAKRFEFLGESSDYTWQIVTLTSEEPRQKYTQSYPAVLKLFRGDWYSAATIYRDWATEQSWASTPVVENADLPSWFVSGEPIMRLENYVEDPGHPVTQYNSFEDVAEKALAFRRELNTPLTVLLIGWEQHAEWDNPFSMPPRDGLAGFSDMLDELHDQGNRLGLARSVSMWADTSPGFPEGGIDAAVVGENGTTPYATMTLCDREILRYEMCPAAIAWRSLVVDNVAYTASLGVDLLGLDEAPIATAIACYATGHGHGVGSGAWAAQAEYSLLAAAQEAAGERNPGMFCPTESPSEYFIAASAGYDARRTYPDGHFWRGTIEAFPGARLAPVFQFVYHEYAIPYTEPKMDHESAFSNSTYIAVSQLLAVISGQVPGFGAQWLSALGAARDWLESTRRSIDVRQSCGPEFLAYGRMQIPPELDVPLVDVEPLREDSEPLRYPAVLTSVWTSPTGAVGYFFANISEDRVVITPQLEGFGVLDTETAMASIWRNGRPEAIRSVSLRQPVELALDSWDVLMVRLSNGSSEAELSPPEVSVTFNARARVVEFEAMYRNRGDRPSAESFIVVGSPKVDLPFGEVYRSIPALAPNRSRQTTGQVTIPWDFTGDLDLTLRCFQPSKTNGDWEWVEVWSERLAMSIPGPEGPCAGCECCGLEDDEVVYVHRVDGLVPAAAELRAPEWSLWVETSTGPTSSRLRPTSLSGQPAIAASNPAHARESMVILEFQTPFDAASYEGIEVVLESPESLPCRVELAFLDCGIAMGDRCGWSTASANCALQTADEPTRYRIPFTRLKVPPWVKSRFPQASDVLNPASIGGLRFCIDEGQSVGTIVIHEVSFYRTEE